MGNLLLKNTHPGESAIISDRFSWGLGPEIENGSRIRQPPITVVRGC